VLVATAPGPTAAEPPQVPALRVSVATPEPVATADVYRLMLGLNSLREQRQRPDGVVAHFLVEDALKLVLIVCHTPKLAQ
jgi:hypothetical protein